MTDPVPATALGATCDEPPRRSDASEPVLRSADLARPVPALVRGRLRATPPSSRPTPCSWRRSDADGASRGAHRPAEGLRRSRRGVLHELQLGEGRATSPRNPHAAPQCSRGWRTNVRCGSADRCRGSQRGDGCLLRQPPARIAVRRLGVPAVGRSIASRGRSRAAVRRGRGALRRAGRSRTPPHWGGYRIEPAAVEFWQGRPDRLHDRLRYRRDGGRWVIERLAP